MVLGGRTMSSSATTVVVVRVAVGSVVCVVVDGAVFVSFLSPSGPLFRLPTCPHVALISSIIAMTSVAAALIADGHGGDVTLLLFRRLPSLFPPISCLYSLLVAEAATAGITPVKHPTCAFVFPHRIEWLCTSMITLITIHSPADVIIAWAPRL